MSHCVITHSIQIVHTIIVYCRRGRIARRVCIIEKRRRLSYKCYFLSASKTVAALRRQQYIIILLMCTMFRFRFYRPAPDTFVACATCNGVSSDPKIRDDFQIFSKLFTFLYFRFVLFSPFAIFVPRIRMTIMIINGIILNRTGRRIPT